MIDPRRGYRRGIGSRDHFVDGLWVGLFRYGIVVVVGVCHLRRLLYQQLGRGQK